MGNSILFVSICIVKFIRIQRVNVPCSFEGDTTPPLTSEPTSDKPPLSPTHEPVKSKREQRQEQESRVYNLATDKLIKNLMTEYKKRKNLNAMPSFLKINKKKNGGKNDGKKQKSSSDPVEQVIEEEQKSSIMKVGDCFLIIMMMMSKRYFWNPSSSSSTSSL